MNRGNDNDQFESKKPYFVLLQYKIVSPKDCPQPVLVDADNY